MATPDPCWWNVPMTFNMKNMLFKLTREIKYQAILINFCYILNTFFTTANLNLKQTNLSITDNLFKFITQYKKSMFPQCHRSTQKDNLSLGLSVPRKDGVQLKGKGSTKFLGVLLYENLTWKDHLNIVENKI